MVHVFDGILSWVPIRLQQNRAVQRLAASLGRAPSPKQWIFIIGCYNSGTTLLNKILASHPDIAGLSCEGVALTDVLPRPEKEGWTRMWHKCYESMCVDPGQADLARRAKRQWSLFFPTGSENLVEKSIANATRIPFLQTHFRPAYFIYLVRDGYAVSEGIRRKAVPERWGNSRYGRQYPLWLCARQWRVTDEIVSKHKKSVDRFIKISYEELTEETSLTIKRVMEFLELKSEIKINNSKKWKIDEKKERIKNMNPKSMQNLSTKEIEKINEEAKSKLQKFGYYRSI